MAKFLSRDRTNQIAAEIHDLNKPGLPVVRVAELFPERGIGNVAALDYVLHRPGLPVLWAADLPVCPTVLC